MENYYPVLILLALLVVHEFGVWWHESTKPYGSTIITMPGAEGVLRRGAMIFAQNSSGHKVYYIVRSVRGHEIDVVAGCALQSAVLAAFRSDGVVA